MDSRRFGGPSSELSPIPLFFGFTQALSLGAEWAPLKEVLLPMQVAERYDVSLDPRGENWLLSGVNGVGYGYQYTVANASVSSAFSDVVTLPNFGGHPPFDQFQMPSLLIGAVAAGAKNPGRSPANRLPRRERHVELPRRRSPLQWFNDTDGRYALPNGVLFTPFGSLLAGTFDGSLPVGRALLPPGRYDGETDFVDPDFSDQIDPRSFDLEPDDNLTSDFGAPMLLGVRPIPGAAAATRR